MTQQEFKRYCITITEKDVEELDAISDRIGGPGRSAAVRFCIREIASRFTSIAENTPAPIVALVGATILGGTLTG